MKKTILAIITLTITSLVSAQNISIGPTGEFGHSWITGTHGDKKFNPMWSAGISFIYSIKTNFGIGADIKYSAEGNKTVINGFAGQTKNTINANYIRVPIKLIYFFGKYGNAVRPKIYAGPNFGFLTTVNLISETTGYSKVKTNFKNGIKNFDLGLTAAAGLNFRLASKTWLNTDVAFYQGLSNITKNEGITQHNGNLGVNVGLLVGL